MRSTGTSIPSTAKTVSAASRMRARLRWASARSGRAPAAASPSHPASNFELGSTEIAPPPLTNGVSVPYSLSETRTPIPIVSHPSRENQTLPGQGGGPGQTERTSLDTETTMTATLDFADSATGPGDGLDPK